MKFVVVITMERGEAVSYSTIEDTTDPMDVTIRVLKAIEDAKKNREEFVVVGEYPKAVAVKTEYATGVKSYISKNQNDDD